MTQINSSSSRRAGGNGRGPLTAVIVLVMIGLVGVAFLSSTPMKTKFVSSSKGATNSFAVVTRLASPLFPEERNVTLQTLRPASEKPKATPVYMTMSPSLSTESDSESIITHQLLLNDMLSTTTQKGEESVIIHEASKVDNSRRNNEIAENNEASDSDIGDRRRLASEPRSKNKNWRSDSFAMQFRSNTISRNERQNASSSSDTKTVSVSMLATIVFTGVDTPTKEIVNSKTVMTESEIKSFESQLLSYFNVMLNEVSNSKNESLRAESVKVLESVIKTAALLGNPDEIKISPARNLLRHIGVTAPSATETAVSASTTSAGGWIELQTLIQIISSTESMRPYSETTIIDTINSNSATLLKLLKSEENGVINAEQSVKSGFFKDVTTLVCVSAVNFDKLGGEHRFKKIENQKFLMTEIDNAEVEGVGILQQISAQEEGTLI